MTKKFLLTIGLLFVSGLVGACSSGSTTNQTAPNAPANQTTRSAANTTNNAAHSKSDDETPAGVKAVFADAQQITKQHKDIPADKIAQIEKDTGGKIPDKDHHSYLAFATRDGKRTQLGAATVVDAGGKEMIVVYESKNGMPTVKEIRADGIAKEFLAQFAGKDHDAPIKFGEDIKANGVDEATAKSVAQAVRIDVLTMEALYGSAHTH